jgi:hypothetical protein
MDDPEPAAQPAVARPTTTSPAPQPSPAASTPPAPRRFDGPPTSGKSLYRWACNAKCLPKVNALGKLHGYPKLVSEWADHEVAAAYAILTAEPVANGKAH